MKQYDANLVAGVIGIPMEEMNVVRQALDQEEHWTHGKGPGWALTGPGVMAALDALDIDQDRLPESFWPDIEDCLLKKNAPPKNEIVVYDGPPIEYKVTFLKLTKNVRVVLAEKNGARVRVLVHGNRNHNFARGMQIPVTHLEGDLYRINCPSPKRRGRWS